MINFDLSSTYFLFFSNVKNWKMMKSKLNQN